MTSRHVTRIMIGMSLAVGLKEAHMRQGAESIDISRPGAADSLCLVEFLPLVVVTTIFWERSDRRVTVGLASGLEDSD